MRRNHVAIGQAIWPTCLLSLVSLCMVAGCESTKANGLALRKVEMAELLDARIVEGEAGEPSTSDGVACRVIKGGRTFAFELDRWWGHSERPAEGRVYLAEVRYRDVVGQPVRFHSYCGLARYEGPTEMHRFGGLSDGRWKTSRVPLSWDMLLSLPSQQGKVKLGIQSPDGDLPVASVAIVPADADAERRYNAETREWVRRVQAEEWKRQDLKVQPAVIPAVMAEAAVLPFARSWMSTIYPHSAPQAGEAGAPVRVRMAMNDFEPATFGVYAAMGKLTNVTYEVGKLTGSAGELVVEVRPGTLEYALQQAGRQGQRVVRAIRIWPRYPVDIERGRSQQFWITLETNPARSRPGKYTGQISIQADQGAAELPMEVEVLPITLLTMDECDFDFGGCTSELVPEHEMQVLRDHNFNIINIWFPGVAPRMEISQGKMSLDFEPLDGWMRTAAKYDMGPLVWFIGGDPHHYPRTLSIEREIYIALHSGEKPRKELYDDFTRKAGLPENRGRPMKEVEPYYRQWIRQVWQRGKDRGWPELIFTPFDEPAVWGGPYREPQGDPPILGPHKCVKDHFKTACRIIHEAAPGSRIYTSIHHNRQEPPGPGRPGKEGEVFIPDVEVFCTNAIGEDPKLGEKVRAAGKTFWQYKGIGDGRNPDQGRFLYGFFHGAYDSKGGLQWAYDWGPGFDTSGQRCWMVSWRTPFDVICSPHFEGTREGWDDRRYVETLKAVATDKGADISAFLAELAEEGKTLRGIWGTSVEYDEWRNAADLDRIEQMRDRVVAKILGIQKQ